MRRFFHVFLILLTFVTLYGCGPSSEEREALDGSFIDSDYIEAKEGYLVERYNLKMETFRNAKAMGITDYYDFKKKTGCDVYVETKLYELKGGKNCPITFVAAIKENSRLKVNRRNGRYGSASTHDNFFAAKNYGFKRCDSRAYKDFQREQRYCGETETQKQRRKQQERAAQLKRICKMAGGTDC